MWHYALNHPKEIVILAVLLLSALSALAAGLGRRTIAIRSFQNLFISLAAGALSGVIAGFAGLSVGGRGEGAGIAALIFGLAAAYGVGLTLLGLLSWLRVLRPGIHRIKETSSQPWIALSVVLAVLFVGFGASLFSFSYSDQALVKSLLLGKRQIRNIDVAAELTKRGGEASPEIVGALREYPPERSNQFESGLNGGLCQTLLVLGRIGDEKAVVELRRWLWSDSAPDVRAIAARALAEAGDTKSAPEIGAKLLEHSDEWHRQRPVLYVALAILKAAGEITTIKTALLSEDTPIYMSNGLECLQLIGTHEALALIREFAMNAGRDLRLAALVQMQSMPSDMETKRIQREALLDSEPAIRRAACNGLLGNSKQSSAYPEVWDQFEYGPCSSMEGSEWMQTAEKIRSLVVL